MRLYKKEGNSVQILSYPRDNIEKGDYLLVEDTNVNRKLITQVIDVQFASVPGLLEELLRDTISDENVCDENFDPLGISSHINCIQDARMLICKIRGTMLNDKLRVNSSWLPSRSKSGITKIPVNILLSHVNEKQELPINIGETKDNEQLNITAHDLDGRLNIITGKKGTGKSHLSKLLVLGLVDYKATVVVLDLNGEYTGLGVSSNGGRNEYSNRVHVLTPGANFKVSLAQMGLAVIMKIMVHALGLPGTSTREFKNIWKTLCQQRTITLEALGDTIKQSGCNMHVRDALFSRYYSLVNSGFFTDHEVSATSFEKLFDKTKKQGGAIVINLKDVSTVDRQIVLEYTLGVLVKILGQWKLQSIFLFAEEAHLYLRETYWEDIVTRMRHFGLFANFVTNQPDTIKENIYRQADSIFLFNFTNERDLETVSKAARVDSETVKSIAQELPPHHCLLIGKAVNDFPVMVKVRALDIKTMGQTRLFFTNN
ncbi:ATP-binding protein [Candidatus Bathyarchaeota archaeon]|nr:ATP-binding protein [Candidatus Bathyarchaeota archaeon]